MNSSRGHQRDILSVSRRRFLSCFLSLLGRYECEREALKSEAQHDMSVSTNYFWCKHTHWQRRRWKDASHHGQSRLWPHFSASDAPAGRESFSRDAFLSLTHRLLPIYKDSGTSCCDLHLSLNHTCRAVCHEAHRDNWRFTFLCTWSRIRNMFITKSRIYFGGVLQLQNKGR